MSFEIHDETHELSDQLIESIRRQFDPNPFEGLSYDGTPKEIRPSYFEEVPPNAPVKADEAERDDRR